MVTDFTFIAKFLARKVGTAAAGGRVTTGTGIIVGVVITGGEVTTLTGVIILRGGVITLKGGVGVCLSRVTGEVGV